MKYSLIVSGLLFIFQTLSVGQQINAPYLFPKDILKWQSNGNSAFNVSVVPLANRFSNPNIFVNNHAKDDEARIVALSTMNSPVSKSPAQFGNKFNIYSFSHWQYIDKLIYWGGSAAEGIIVPPTAEVTDAAHRNGVQVLGTIFFPPNAYGGKIEWLDDLLLKESQRFPVADKLIEMAEYFNFDGWFINQETDGSTKKHADLMIDFIEYIKENSDLYIMWYDAMTIEGNMDWQGQLNNKNHAYIQSDKNISNSMFIDFRWERTPNSLLNTNIYALNKNIDPYNLFAGIEINGDGKVNEVPYSNIIREGEPATTSIGLFNPDLIYSSSNSPLEYYERENNFWTGIMNDPRNTELIAEWPGAAHIVKARSPITKLPFVTHFNTGNGKGFYFDGKIVSNNEWYNRSLQDILPTWRWIVEGKEKTLTPNFSWDDSYFGGSSLKISGDIKKDYPNKILLYSTKLKLANSSEINIVYKQNSTNSKVKVGLSFWGNENSFNYFDISSNIEGEWIEKTILLNNFAGKSIAQIALLFDPIETDTNYQFNFGKLGISNASSSIKKQISDLQLVKFELNDEYSANIQLSWQNDTETTFTNTIFRKNSDTSLEYIVSTPNNIINLPFIERKCNETYTELIVEAINDNFIESSIDTINIHWGDAPSNNPPIARANGPYFTSVNEEIIFDASGSIDREDENLYYEWYVNNLLIGKGKTIKFSFEKTGKQQLTLKVTDAVMKYSVDTTYVNICNNKITLEPDLVWLEFEKIEDGITPNRCDSKNNFKVINTKLSTGMFGSGMEFTGNESYLLTNNFPIQDSTISITLWALATERGVWNSLIKNWAGKSGAFHLGLMNNDGDLELQVAQSDDKVHFLREGKENKFPLNEWQFVAFVANGKNIILYRNGVEVDRTDYDGTLKTKLKIIGIGAKPNDEGTGELVKSTAGFWQGKMDDVRIFSRPLNIQEIKKLYHDKK